MGQRIVERPWAVVAADMMEFPPSKTDGKSVATAFEELVLFRWETPDISLTDNGKEFDNKFLKETLQEYGVKHITTPPYHLQANPVERSKRTLKTMIATFIGNDHRDCDLHVHEFRHAMNTATQVATKTSPAFLNYGRHPGPVKSLRREVEQRDQVKRIAPVDWVDRVKRLDALRDLVAKFIDKERD
ncbi:uncharacterized protein LOC127286086 [Leptopilina boulardi]|uniref:uncharacterized protein LOC127286086 n=1 Tax=Leptopilina boulardi TaxID=63433 RepID=UPI0021F6680A|nr:uncharacterized protein LOC127286086 [Leptopilina boulardi]